MHFPIINVILSVSYIEELIAIRIELKPESKFEKLTSKLHNNFENILFSLIQKIPERFIPQFIINWVGHYATKRTQQLQQDILRQRWQQVELERFLQEIKAEKEKAQ